MALITVQAVDPSSALTRRGKFFVIATGSMELRNGNIYLRHVYRARLEAPDQVKAITDLYLRWKPLYVGIESIFWQSSLIQYLDRKGIVPTKAIDRRKQGNANTGVRAMALAARYERGQIFHPRRTTENQDWLDAFEEELLAFTGDDSRDEYTDQVSAWADVVHELVTYASRFVGIRDEPAYHGFSYDDHSPFDLAPVEEVAVA